MSKLTDEQRNAVETDGKTIVSASAGSGKTTVMIQKITDRIVNGELDMNELLAITFTKKAASQMKEKLKKSLIDAVNSTDDFQTKARLKEQLSFVADADVSTIDSFCARLLRTHFFMVGVSGDFSVIDANDAQGKTLKTKSLNKLFDEAYQSGDERFMKLLSVYFRKKKDALLKKIVLSVHEILRSRADYENYTALTEPSEENFDAVVKELYENLLAFCEREKAQIERAEALVENDEKMKTTQQNAESYLVALKMWENAGDYFKACQVDIGKLPIKQRATKNDDFSEDELTAMSVLQNCRAEIVDLFASLRDVRGREEELADYLSAGELATSLMEYVLRFDRYYTAEKQDKNVLDYADLEYCTLKLLQDEEVRKEVCEKYKYVFVDEYQDVNPLQEKIISLVGGEKLFLVGDIKQSIYAFRGSRSKYFALKQKEYAVKDNALYLKKNFRSAPEIIRFVNAVFRKSMTKDVCEVDYTFDSVMEGGDGYADKQGEVFLHRFLPKKEEKESVVRGVYSVVENYLTKQRALSDYALQVRKIIQDEVKYKKYYEIRFTIENGEPKKTLVEKKVDYKDIAVLSSKRSHSLDEILEALALADIPVCSDANMNICLYPEIKTVLDVFRLLDNFYQDIPLCSTLLSSFGNCHEEDLVQIRLAYPDTPFVDAVQLYATEKNDKLSDTLKKFLARYEKFRQYSAVESAGELLERILTETGLERDLLKKDDVVGTVDRIRALMDFANAEKMTVHEFLEKLQALDGVIEYKGAGSENAVQVMTIHGSKGLEFPVVLLNDVSESFGGRNDPDFAIDETYGLCTKAFDETEMVYRSTLLERLIREREEKEEIKAELNLFYVALTRAKYRLHLLLNGKETGYKVVGAKSFENFIPTELFNQETYVIETELTPKSEITPIVDERRINPEKTQEIIEELEREYAFSGGENLQIKTSYTDLSKRASSTETLQDDVPFYADPTLKREDKRLSGIAYHGFLEYYDFSGTDALEIKIEKAIEKLAENGISFDGEPDRDLLKKIVQNPVFDQIKGKTVYRERPFLAYLPAKEVYDDETKLGRCGDEPVLFQGVFDWLAIGENDAWIIDYKYSVKNREQLKTDYCKQLDLYKKSLAKILKTDFDRIRTTIVNIRSGEQIDL